MQRSNNQYTYFVFLWFILETFDVGSQFDMNVNIDKYINILRYVKNNSGFLTLWCCLEFSVILLIFLLGTF